jgi:hypothetical protein
MNPMFETNEFAETVVGAPPEGWVLGHVTIMRRTKNAKPIEAWRRGAFAVHEVFAPHHGGRLTHAPTGLANWTFDTMDKAADLAERIEGLADWGTIKSELPSGSGLYPKVRAIIDEIEAIECAAARQCG